MILQSPRRSGNILLISIFPFLALLMLIALQVNTARLVTSRVMAQHAADAAAHAAALEMARAMNAITALQHLIGQLNALGALVMSFGGVELEEGKIFPLNNGSLRRAYADALRYGTTVHPVVGYELLRESKSASGASIGRSRRRLQEVMTWAYRVHAAGGVLATEPVLYKFRGVGIRLVNAAVTIEKNVVFEWKVLATMEQLAKHVFLPLKHISNPTIIPYLHDYSIRWAEDAPVRAAAAAREVARTYGDIDSTLFPAVDGRPALRLPIEHEPQLFHNSPYLEQSQMVRATTPWVQYYRPPILSFSRQILPLSRFARFYHEESNGFTLKMAVWKSKELNLKNVIPGGRPTRLFRLIGTDPGVADKGREIWNVQAGSARADELFCILGFARHAPVSVMGYPAFPQTQPDGIAGSAQAMIYNANPQNGATRSRWQPVAGWDTLNWENEVPEFQWGKDYGKNENVPQPRVFLNWQVKLVPMTRLKDAAGTQSSQLNRILGRTIADRGIANLH
ncbi:MAG: hypothetical protein K1X57_07025 [Gemmataceae bacterium]|nr:hypothetical protein [Gemmataceae bacterium]